jgi:hypothetical protein
MHTCETCGKEWPENYCPACGHTIGKASTPPVVPPPLPPPVLSASPKPPPVPARGNASAKKSSQLPLVIGLVALMAAVGCVVVYILLKRDALPDGYRNKPTAGWGTRKGEAEFDKANDQIDSFQGKTAFGNSDEAVKLANRFSELFKAARGEMFTKAFPIEVLDNTKGEFMTCCELHAQECAFIVHVPGLRKFEKNMFEKVDARKALAELAWVTAQKVLKEQSAGRPQMELAVGLRGISQYGPIQLGYYDENAREPGDGLVKYLDEGAQTQFLWTFFAPENAPATR